MSEMGKTAAMAGAGFSVGAALGLLDGALAWSGAPGFGSAALWVGPLVDGTLGAGVGALVGTFWKPSVGRLGLLPGVVACGVGVLASVWAPAPRVTPETAVDSPSLLWIVVNGLDSTSASDAERYPNLAALGNRSIRYEASRAVADEPSVALASLLTGRLPEGHGVLGRGDGLAQNVSTGLQLLGKTGYQTFAVVEEGMDSLVAADHLVQLPRPRPGSLTPDLAGLTPYRMLEPLLPMQAPVTFSGGPDGVSDAVSSLYEQAGPGQGQAWLVVLGDVYGDLTGVDSLVGELVSWWDARSEPESLLVLSGAYVDAAGDEPAWGGRRDVPVYFAMGDTNLPDPVARWTSATTDVLPNVLQLLRLQADAKHFDGENTINRVLAAPVQRRAASEFATLDPCDGPRKALGPRLLLERVYADGQAAGSSVYGDGYVLLMESDRRGRLYDDMEPWSPGDISMRSAVITCGGETVREREKRFARELTSLQERARARVDLPPLEVKQSQGLFREDFPVHSRYRD